jgi:hypothetical protein
MSASINSLQIYKIPSEFYLSYAKRRFLIALCLHGLQNTVSRATYCPRATCGVVLIYAMKCSEGMEVMLRIFIDISLLTLLRTVLSLCSY